MAFNFVEAEEVLLLMVGPNNERKPVEVGEACEGGPGHWSCTCDKFRSAQRFRRVAPVARDLWISSRGVVACDEHGGDYLRESIRADATAEFRITPLDTWVRLRPEHNVDHLKCEGCS